MSHDYSFLGSPEELSMAFISRRSIVYSTRGMVCSSQPLACQAGLDILRQGGNAADAAVATAAALNVTEPCSCGIGGDCFVLYYDGQTKKVSALNGSGRSPKALTLEKARQMGINGEEIPAENINSVTVPGAVAAFADTLQLFGSGRVSLNEVLQPAIRLAEEGYPVSEIVAHSWQQAESLLKKASANASEMLRNDRAPRAGQIMTMPYLAKTLREIGNKGHEGFYRGYVAQAIVDLIQSQGGVMTLEDLAEHRSTPVQPISIPYGLDGQENVRVWECPPNGQGIVALMAIGILKALQRQGKIAPLETMQHNSAEYLHVLIEALRLAFADAQYFVCDPQVNKVPVEELLSDTYLSTLAETFRPKQSNVNIEHGHPVNSSDTVYFAVTDSQGNACSFIFSNYMGFGTGAIPKQCGFTLQNRASNFRLEENHPNCLDGGKRPYHTIIPAMITYDNGDLLACYGVMGGFMQPQGHLQVLCNMLHHRMSVQAALDAPRFCILPKLGKGTSDDSCSEVLLEDGISGDVIEQLKSYGHRTRLIGGNDRSIFGRGQVIARVYDGSDRLVWAAGSDPRADGQANGW